MQKLKAQSTITSFSESQIIIVHVNNANPFQTNINVSSGASRISQTSEEGGGNPKVGTPTYYLAEFFSRKLHKNERIGPKGGHTPGIPP